MLKLELVVLRRGQALIKWKSVVLQRGQAMPKLAFDVQTTTKPVFALEVVKKSHPRLHYQPSTPQLSTLPLTHPADCAPRSPASA